jgi:hypothetical protein
MNLYVFLGAGRSVSCCSEQVGRKVIVRYAEPSESSRSEERGNVDT